MSIMNFLILGVEVTLLMSVLHPPCQQYHNAFVTTLRSYSGLIIGNIKLLLWLF